MKRLFLYPLAVAVAVVPAATGLLSNASFSQGVPVRTPASAEVLVEHSQPEASHSTPTGTPTTRVTGHAEPGDDYGGSTTHADPGDDHGGSTTHAEPGDDHGGSTSGSSRRGSSTHDGSATHDTSSDDSGHGGKDSGGHGSDD